jgi:hypothetical protein
MCTGLHRYRCGHADRMWMRRARLVKRSPRPRLAVRDRTDWPWIRGPRARSRHEAGPGGARRALGGARIVGRQVAEACPPFVREVLQRGARQRGQVHGVHAPLAVALPGPLDAQRLHMRHRRDSCASQLTHGGGAHDAWRRTGDDGEQCQQRDSDHCGREVGVGSNSVIDSFQASVNLHARCPKRLPRRARSLDVCCNRLS